VRGCRNRRYSLCGGTPFAQGDKPDEYHSDILPTVILRAAKNLDCNADLCHQELAPVIYSTVRRRKKG
jgi:hypothetical protein